MKNKKIIFFNTWIFVSGIVFWVFKIKDYLDKASIKERLAAFNNPHKDKISD